MTGLLLLALGLATLPAALLLLNLLVYRRLPQAGSDSREPGTPGISILIPVRNEEEAIAGALQSILTHPAPSLEVLVLDDHSTDATASIVRSIATADPRVRLVQGAPLPPGWCGKQHACWQLAHEAAHDNLVFLDADVRLLPGAIRRISQLLQKRPHIHLFSGVPRQITGSFLERLLIPLIHFILLGYLPIPFSRLSRNPAFAAGCGQLFIARRPAYLAVDGHRSIRSSLHDGVKLPRTFRAGGWQTDLLDATDLAECRMYRNASEVWRGLGKNAIEGLAHPAAIVPWSILLLGGQVLPWVLLLEALVSSPAHLTPAALVAGLTLFPRLLAAARFRQSWIGAALHPLGILLLVTIQWCALFRHWRGRPSEWRGRHYAAASASPRSVPCQRPTTP